MKYEKNMISDGLLGIIKDNLLIPSEFRNRYRLLEWCNNKKSHNLNGPADIRYNEDGNKIFEEWHQNEDLYKLNRAVQIEYYENGAKKYEYWYRNGFYHNLNGPAKIYYYDNGNKKSEEWWENGKYIKIKIYKEN